MNVADMKPPTREPNPAAVSEVYALFRGKVDHARSPIRRSIPRAYRAEEMSPSLTISLSRRPERSQESAAPAC
jgi:hypothetical protein